MQLSTMYVHSSDGYGVEFSKADISTVIFLFIFVKDIIFFMMRENFGSPQGAK
jgi:hypothetical protein